MSNDRQAQDHPHSGQSLASAAAVKELLTRHNLKPRHTLGQNFIVRPEPIETTVAAAAISPGDTVLEIGPGLGALTRALALRAERVRAVELDRSFEPVLAETVGCFANVQVTFADARDVDFAQLVAPAQGAQAKAVANLPYYVTTPLLERLIWSPASFACIVVLVQAEAVGRIIAGPGDDGYGPLSLLIECFYEAALIARVPRDSFWPQPKVDSALVSLKRRAVTPSSAEAKELFGLIEATFAQRRKTVAAALAHNRGGAGGLPELPRELVVKALSKAGLDPAVRAEQMNLQQFRDLARALRNQVTQG